jgi:hypothetical protein
VNRLAADQDELLRALSRYGVGFGVVGGAAVIQTGTAAREYRLDKGLAVVVAAP